MGRCNNGTRFGVASPFAWVTVGFLLDCPEREWAPKMKKTKRTNEVAFLTLDCTLAILFTRLISLLT
jgi:hypothetical protein